MSPIVQSINIYITRLRNLRIENNVCKIWTTHRSCSRQICCIIICLKYFLTGIHNFLNFIIQTIQQILLWHFHYANNCLKLCYLYLYNFASNCVIYTCITLPGHFMQQRVYLMFCFAYPPESPAEGKCGLPRSKPIIHFHQYCIQ